MRAHPDCGACGAQLLNPDGSRQNSIANFPTLATEMINKSLLRRLWPSRFPGKEQTFATPVEVESVVGAFFLTRKDLWDKLGGLDEDYFFFLEETDFCFRVRKAGLRIMHLPQVQVRHEQGGSAGGMRAAARIEYWRSRYLFFSKHRRPGVRLALQIGLAGRLLIDTLASGLMTLLSFGRSERWRQKFASYRALMAWHWLGRPENRGLPR
jgi:GT2 family glycosyltransferase